MKSIAAFIDFSEISKHVIEQAAAIARRFYADLHIIHIAAPDPAFVSHRGGHHHERDWRALNLHKEHQMLHDTAVILSGEGLSVTPVLIQGDTVDKIMEESQRLHADLLVLGSHGHGALYNLVMGSVCEEVLHRCSRPMLLIPPVKRT
ncbi:MAG: universal stress protein [Magnetococcales bacterium]|nr:universal stress protein [Magnetococcales bacterium]